MFYIEDGREYFYQWDADRRLVVEDPSIKEVHFCNRTGDCSLVCETYVDEGVTVANVPNILLQTDWKIRVYAYDGKHTKHDDCFEVKGRTKPADYIYTETEVITVESAIEQAIAGGDFKGDKGEPGEPGYTPVRGVDYWTDEDKSEITYYIDSQIGLALEGEY